MNETDTPAEPAEESTPTDPTVESVMETADSSPAPQISNFTMHFDMRVEAPNGSYVENRTIRASRVQDRFLLEMRDQFDSDGTRTIVVERYGTPETVFARTTLLGPNGTSTYERVNRTDESIDLNASLFEDKFDFDHELTDDGDHRFTADSVDQYLGPAPENGSIEELSAVLIVDEETGLIRDARFRIVGSNDRGRFTRASNVTLAAIDETTVPEPDWLSTARNRTETRASGAVENVHGPR